MKERTRERMLPLLQDQGLPLIQRRDDPTIGHVPAELVTQGTRSGGQTLDTATRAGMESRFGHDFSKVRVHTDQQAAESARSFGAHAYTVGSDVVFGAGKYKPEAASGQKLLAHELTHVVQQSHTQSLAVQRDAAGDAEQANLPIQVQISRALTWSSRPDYQKVCRLLNGLSISDMLRQLENIKIMGHLTGLQRTLAAAEGIFRERVEAAIYATLGSTGAHFDAVLAKLPTDQQQELRQYAEIASTPRSQPFGLGGLSLPGAPGVGGVPGPLPGTPAADNPLIESVKRAFSKVPTEVKIERQNGKAVLSVTGLTATLRGGGAELEGSVSWGGTLGLKSSFGGFHLGAELDDKQWKLKLSYPSDSAPPNMAKLGTVFREAEGAMRNIVAESAKFSSLKDASAVQAAIEPHTPKVKEAIEALGDIAETKPGVSFGISAEGPRKPPPNPGAGDSGFTIQATITITF